MKKNNLMIALLVIVLAIGLSSCQKKNNNQSKNVTTTFDYDAENYKYQGGKLTEQQLKGLEDSMVEIVQKIVQSVNESKTEVDLSKYTNNEQWILMSMQLAATVDPFVEVASFEVDNKIKGLYHIE